MALPTGPDTGGSTSGSNSGSNSNDEDNQATSSSSGAAHAEREAAANEPAPAPDDNSSSSSTSGSGSGSGSGSSGKSGPAGGGSSHVEDVAREAAENEPKPAADDGGVSEDRREQQEQFDPRVGNDSGTDGTTNVGDVAREAAETEPEPAPSESEQDSQEVAESLVDTTLQEGLEGSAGQSVTVDGQPVNVQEQARDLEQQAIDELRYADDPSDVAIQMEDGQLVARPTRSATVESTAREIQQFREDLTTRAPDRIFSGTERLPVGVDVQPGDVVLDVTGDNSIVASFDQETQEEIVRQKAARQPGGFAPEDLTVDQTDSGLQARPSEDALRERVASSDPNIDPEDVEIGREDGEIVATATVGGRGGLESQFLPSVDVDTKTRTVDVDTGDPVGATREALSRRRDDLAEAKDSLTEGEVGLLAGAAATGVAVPEPSSSVAGAAILSGLAVGTVAYQATRGSQQGEGAIDEATTVTATGTTTEVGLGDHVATSEVEVGETTRQAEIDVARSRDEVSELEPASAGASATTVEPGEGFSRPEIPISGGGDSGGGSGEQARRDESHVPDEFPLPGRDIPRNPREDRPEEVTPRDILDTGVTASPLQQQRQSQRQDEEAVVEEELRRRRRSQNRELDEILRGPSEEVTIGREPGTGFQPEREFPTGASAVIGRETSRLEEAQASELGDETVAEFGQGDAFRPRQEPLLGPVEDGGGAEVRSEAATTTQHDTGQEQTPLSQSIEATEAVTETAATTGTATQTNTLSESLFDEQYVTQEATGRGRAPREFHFGLDSPEADLGSGGGRGDDFERTFDFGVASPEDVLSGSDVVGDN